MFYDSAQPMAAQAECREGNEGEVYPDFNPAGAPRLFQVAHGPVPGTLFRAQGVKFQSSGSTGTAWPCRRVLVSMPQLPPMPKKRGSNRTLKFGKTGPFTTSHG